MIIHGRSVVVLSFLSKDQCRQALAAVAHDLRQPAYCGVCGIDLCTNPDVAPTYTVAGEVVFRCDCQGKYATSIRLTRQWLVDRGILPAPPSMPFGGIDPNVTS